MTGTQTLIARAALGAIAATASVALTGWGRLYALPRRSFDRLALAVLVVSRLGLFASIFLVLHVAPRGDVQAFYAPQAIEVLHHHLPYRDFLSSYAPLHPYLDAVFIAVRNTPLSIMFFSVLAEFLLLRLWLTVGRSFVPEVALRTAALLYLASPVSLQFVTVDGQDNVLIAVLLAVALLLLQRHRPLLSGAAVGLAAATVKFLPLLYAPVFFVAAPRRWRWAAGAAAVLVAVYGWFLMLHAPILQPLSVEGDLRSAGDLAYVFEAISGLQVPGRVSDLLLMGVIGLLVALAARAALRASEAARLQVLTLGMSAVTFALLLLAKKSWPPYLMLALFPICLLVSGASCRRTLRLILFAFFSLVAVAEHSVWAVLGEPKSLLLHRWLLEKASVGLPFLGLEFLLLAGYGWLLVEAVRQLRVPTEERVPSTQTTL